MRQHQPKALARSWPTEDRRDPPPQTPAVGMFDTADPDDLAEGALCDHYWVVEGVMVGDDRSVAVEKVCRYCGALRLTIY